jgi:hypothetical protein
MKMGLKPDKQILTPKTNRFKYQNSDPIQNYRLQRIR